MTSPALSALPPVPPVTDDTALVTLSAGLGRKLPIGLQLLGKALDEARIFQIAHAYEQSTDWRKARPAIEPIAA